jgi:TRAP-type C4-dicarboxylate transport system permease small subunit
VTVTASTPSGSQGPTPTRRSGALAAADRLLALAENGFLVVLVAALVIVVDIQVFYRYVLNNPLIWPEEIARLFLIWITMIGAGVVSRHGSHLRVDAGLNALPRRLRDVALTLADAVVVLVVLVLMYYTRVTMAASSTMRTVAVGLPVSLMFLPLLLGGVLIVLYTGAGMVRRWTHAGRSDQDPENPGV